MVAVVAGGLASVLGIERMREDTYDLAKARVAASSESRRELDFLRRDHLISRIPTHRDSQSESSLPQTSYPVTSEQNMRCVAPSHSRWCALDEFTP